MQYVGDTANPSLSRVSENTLGKVDPLSIQKETRDKEGYTRQTSLPCVPARRSWWRVDVDTIFVVCLRENTRHIHQPLLIAKCSPLALGKVMYLNFPLLFGVNYDVNNHYWSWSRLSFSINNKNVNWNCHFYVKLDIYYFLDLLNRENIKKTCKNNFLAWTTESYFGYINLR